MIIQKMRRVFILRQRGTSFKGGDPCCAIYFIIKRWYIQGDRPILVNGEIVVHFALVHVTAAISCWYSSLLFGAGHAIGLRFACPSAISLSLYPFHCSTFYVCFASFLSCFLSPLVSCSSFVLTRMLSCYV